MIRSGRRGSVYLAIIVVIAAVTMLVMTGVALRKQINERAQLAGQGSDASRLAVSAAELAIEHAYRDTDAFIARSFTGTIFSNLNLSAGAIAATVTDADTQGPVQDETERFRVVADARVGQARSRIGFEMDLPEDDLTRYVSVHNRIVAYWPLDEVNQTTAVDKINARNGVYGVQSAAGAMTHEHGNPAPRVQWVTEHIRVPHRSAFELANGTLCFWIRFDLKPTTSGIQMAAISKERSPLGSSVSLSSYLTDNHFYYTLEASSGIGRSIRFSSNRIVEGQWHFIALTWGSNGMELYLDGVRRADHSGTTVGLNGIFLIRPANTQDWYFGVRNIPWSTYDQSSPTFGSVARVMLFSAQLSGSTINELYEASSMPPGFRVIPGSFARVVD
ncbi:MAG: LamG domain-containing protein [Phycisphaerales bacterium]|nr:LamG domain-containing protein [Planctomycetota bacterium]MCH8507785.1 LamG domain-containing protein [Phycisphaerales bacterium]